MPSLPVVTAVTTAVFTNPRFCFPTLQACVKSLSFTSFSRRWKRKTIAFGAASTRCCGVVALEAVTLAAVVAIQTYASSPRSTHPSTAVVASRSSWVTNVTEGRRNEIYMWFDAALFRSASIGDQVIGVDPELKSRHMHPFRTQRKAPLVAR